MGPCKHKSEVILHGEVVVLEPYGKEHVPIYHEWMQDAELLRLTASEPLTLQEEYDMQESWASDPNKCTFILLDKSRWNGEHPGIEAMAGDVNLYWNDHDRPHVVEIEVMTADARSRRKGIATEALRLMMAFAVSEHSAQGFAAKILADNVASRMLFEKEGFRLVKEVPCFSEAHYEFNAGVSPDAWAGLLARAAEVPAAIRSRVPREGKQRGPG